MIDYITHIYYYLFYKEYRIVYKYGIFWKENGLVVVKSISTDIIFRHYSHLQNVYFEYTNNYDSYVYFTERKMTNILLKIKGLKSDAIIRNDKLKKI